VKGDLDLNAKLHDSSEVSIVMTAYLLVVLSALKLEFITIIILLIIQKYVISFSGLVRSKQSQE